MVTLATTLALSVTSLALAERPPPGPKAAVNVAQAGVTFGPSDDRGPRYDPGLDRWETYRPPYGKVCGWVMVRTPPMGNGKVALRRQHVCGFKAPARQ